MPKSRKFELQNRIQQAQATYYNNDGKFVIADELYDAWVDELTALDPNNPAITQIGADVEINEWKKAAHKIPMGSLDKVNTLEELHSWIVKRYSLIKSRAVFITEKLDGISIELVYEKGKLVSAVTRGNGIIGEDIFSNVKKMNGVPATIEKEITCVVRGEIVLTKENHAKYFSEYANPRNAASGIAKRYDGTGSEHLNVLSYQIITDEWDFDNDLIAFDFLRNLGFKTPKDYWYTYNDPQNQKQNFIILANGVNKVMKHYESKKRDELPYEIDGLVIRIGSIEEQLFLGETNMKPKGAVAWKFAAAMKETTIKEIIVQVGNSGRITPVAVVEPTHLVGVTIERASLHNFPNIKKLGIDVGAKVLLKRANDVIPYIESVTQTTGTVFKTPEQCPVCNANVFFEGEFLVCNNDNCPSRVRGKIKNWIKALGVLEWGDSLIDKLLEEEKIKTIADLYRLTEQDLSSLERMGEKSAKKAIKILDDSKEITLEQFIGGLSISMIGETITGLLSKAGINTIDKLQKCDEDDFTEVQGIGSEKASKLYAGLKENKDLIEDLLKYIKIKEIKEKTGILVKKSFCFSDTKQKKAVLEKMVTDNGGDVASVNKQLSFLVVGDINSTTSKAVKARKNNVSIISEEDFLEMVK